MWRDLRFSLRSLIRRPLFSTIVILTISLGIAGSTAIFSIVNATLLRELPYPDGDQLYLMRTLAPDGSPTGRVTPRESRSVYDTLEHPTVAAGAIVWSQDVQIVGSDGVPYPTLRYGVTDGFFRVFGESMQLGQAFEYGQNPGPIIITYPIWRDVFASDPEIIGKIVTAEGAPREVVGVTPEGFTFPREPGYFYLMRLGTAYDAVRGYEAFLRLRDGQTRDQLQAELTRLAAELGPDPTTNEPTVLIAEPFLDYLVGDLGTTVMILFGATGILLLIACINVTNLFLSRSALRAREMALREAIGAARWRNIRQMVVESLILAVLGGVVGLAFAATAVRVFLQIAPAGLPRLDTVPIDRSVLLFAVAVALATGMLISLAPAWRLRRTSLRSIVNEGGRGTAGGPGRGSLLSGLVVTEIALAAMLVVAAGLLVGNYSELTGTDPGFDPERVLTLSMNVPGRTEFEFAQGPDGQPRISGSYQPMAAFFRELEARLASLAGVEAVASTSSLPLGAEAGIVQVFDIPGAPGSATDQGVRTAVTRAVSPTFFEALDIKVLAGRPFLPTDRADTRGVAVVNSTFADRFFPGTDAVGQILVYPDNRYVPGDVGFQLAHRVVDEVEIIGVVEDVHYLSLAEPPEPSIYLSSEQWTHRRRTVVIRTAMDDPESLVPAVRTELEALDPSLTADFALYTPIVYASTANERLGMSLLVAFSSVALLLAAVGIYGLVSYSVTERRGEIAVRSAMGATRSEVMRLILRQGVILATEGAILGVLGALALRQAVASQLFGMDALDGRVFVVAPLALLGVATLASLMPASRATRIEPAELLRTD